jgi:hypothetical protein
MLFFHRIRWFNQLSRYSRAFAAQKKSPVTLMNAEEKYLFDLNGFLIVRGVFTAEEVAAANIILDKYVSSTLFSFFNCMGCIYPSVICIVTNLKYRNDRKLCVTQRLIPRSLEMDPQDVRI